MIGSSTLSAVAGGAADGRPFCTETPQGAAGGSNAVFVDVNVLRVTTTSARTT